jgi:hypothetical protein
MPHAAQYCLPAFVFPRTATQTQAVPPRLTLTGVTAQAVADFSMGTFTFTVNETKAFKVLDSTSLPADFEKCLNGRLGQEMARHTSEHCFLLRITVSADATADDAAGRAATDDNT